MTVWQQIFRVWRFCGTTLAFAVFGLGGVITPVLAYPVLRLMPGGTRVRQRRARKLVHWLFKGFVYFMRLLGLLKWQVTGSAKLERPGLLLLANHPTLLDVVFLVAFIPDAVCLVKSRLLSNPAMRGFISLTGYITNDDGVNLIKSAGEAMASGSTLVIFPEGTRTHQGTPPSLQRGAANIAVRCERNITPVIIQCTPPTLSKEHKWYHIPERPLRMTFAVKEDIAITDFKHGTNTQGSRELTRYLEQFFTRESQRHVTG